MVRVIAFPGMTNLALFAGQARGVFARRGVEITVEFTPNSDFLRDRLANGTYDVAHAAVDNAVAMVELAGADVVIVQGGERSLNELFVQSDINSVAELRGRPVIVDAPNTAFALQLKKILRLHGLEAGRDYTVVPIGNTPQRWEAMRDDRRWAAAMLGPPFSVLARRHGLRSLGLAVTFIGPYQGTGIFTRRAWAREHADELVRYLAALIEAGRWALAPANRREAEALLAERLKLPADVAAAAWEAAADPVSGLSADGGFDVEGFRNVLALRAEIEGQWGGTPPPPERYYDLSYARRALTWLLDASRSSLPR
ncbi:MAG: ABC transporter substrate-binding protein [Candidatus Rokubacteria bacterium]|nr:ABC transporter substrate-binding protein [Candidatus Rokubacteria bacterium]